MFRDNYNVRPLEEEMKEFGLDAPKVMNEMAKNMHLVENLGGNDKALLKEEEELKAKEEEIELENEDEDEDELDEDVLDEAKYKLVKKGFRSVDGKMVRVSKKQRQKEKQARREKKSSLRSLAKQYYKRFKAKIAKRRKKRAKLGTRKGFRAVSVGESTQHLSPLALLKEELETENITTSEVFIPEETVLNAGWLAYLIGEIFEAMGDVDAGTMLYQISDKAASLSERIEGIEEEDLTEDQAEEIEKLATMVAKALKTYEDIGEPSLFEAFEQNKNALAEDEDLDDEDELDEDFDDEDLDDDEDSEEETE